MDGINNSTIDANISSPHTIENLSWSTTYDLIIRTSTNFGESLTPFNFIIGSEPRPGKIEGLVAEAGEASIAAVTNDGRLIEESADLLFHLIVLLKDQNYSLVDVLDELKRRSSNQ